MSDRQLAAKWAHDLLQRDDWCVLDTETTGFNGKAEIVQIAVVAPDETVLLESIVRPTVPVEDAARAVHKITDEALAVAHRFDAVSSPFLQCVDGRDIVIYNASFDLRMLRQSAKPYRLSMEFPKERVHCAMHWYSRWLGAKAKLPGGDHSAVGDCIAVIRVMEEMAASHKPDVDSRIPGIEQGLLTGFF